MKVKAQSKRQDSKNKAERANQLITHSNTSQNNSKC